MVEVVANFNLNPQPVIEAGFDLNASTGDHNKLYNRGLPDQHPISAITGLQEALAKIPTDYVTDSQLETALSTKQDTISDLETIRTNASNGASAYTTIQSYGNIVTHNANEFATAAQGVKADTAVQPSDLTPYATQEYVDAADNGLQGQIDANTSDIADINALIPNQATTSNQLADKSFVNSSIATNTAYFIGTFNSVAELEAYSGTLTNNDYAFVATTDIAGNTLYDRYKWNGSQWLFEYELNNSSFTASQWASINSNATAEKIAKISTNETAINNHIANTSNPHSVTKAQVGLGNVDDTSDLSKPISTATQTALNGKQATLVSGTNIKTINNSSVLGSGNLSVGTVKSVNNTSPDSNGNVALALPTVNNSTITLTQGGVTKGSFTLNQASGATIALDAGGGSSYTAGNGIDITSGIISVTSPTLVNKNASGLSILGNTTSGSSTAIGKNATASGDNSIAISGSNYTTTSTGLTSVAIGAQADATNTLALALGGYAKATGYCSIQIGYGTNTEASSLYVGTSFSDNWKLLGSDGLIPAGRIPISTSVDNTSTNSTVVGAKLFYDTCGDIETLINAL